MSMVWLTRNRSAAYTCMYGRHFQQRRNQPSNFKVAIPARGQLNRENDFSSVYQNRNQTA